jgi:hypothetical protein
MTSRLLRRLDAAIAAAASPVETACLGAERVVVLARRGQLDQARAELDQVRQRFGRAAHPAVTGWLCLAEGLLNQLGDLSGGGLDRLQRAHALAGAARLQPLRALAAAWLAHAYCELGDDAQMVRLLADALQAAAADHHSARARACVVAGRAYHLAGRAEVARTFYSRAREHATAEGDDATLSAILHDMARHRVRQVQLAELLEPGAAADPRQALLAVDSWTHFDRGAGTASQEPVAAMLRAQILVSQARFDEALALHDQHLAAALAQGMARREAPLRADMAWCRLQTGFGDAARAIARDADTALLGSVNGDDRALAHARLAQVFDALGLHAAAAQHHSEARVRWQHWQVQCAGIVRLLDDALGPLHAGAVTTDTSEAVKSSP